MTPARPRTDWHIETPPHPQEAALIDVVSEMRGHRLLCTSPGLAQFAGRAAVALPHAVVTCTFLDAYRARLASEYWGQGLANLHIECAADLPNDEADIVAFPFSSGGEAELTRDLIQAGYQCLTLGGKLYVTTENPHDTWLGMQLRKLFKKIERRAMAGAVLYVGTKCAPLKKIKNFSCEFAFRDCGRLIRAFSRPGVFSHRRIDRGARRLIDAMQVDATARVLDIGCGSGVVALAAACRADQGAIHAVDSNARAVQSTQHGAARNGFTNVTTELNAVGGYRGSGTYDLALANPPYYSDYRIARHFLTAGRAALRAGGTMLVVTKQPDWYRQNMPEWYEEISIIEVKGYYLIQGVRPV
jgi:16S rRNA (guanine1207-N2)-methyltransferase